MSGVKQEKSGKQPSHMNKILKPCAFATNFITYW